MKFGRQLIKDATPEWRGKYVSYEALKRILEDCVQSAPSMETEEWKKRKSETDAKFFAKCESDLNKLNQFYLKSLTETQIKFNDLLDELQRYKQRNPSGAFHFPKSFARFPFNLIKKTAHAARKASEDAESQMRFKFSEFYFHLVLLQNYQQLNFTGFRKILKKRDKLLGDSAGLEWRQKHVEKAAFYQNADLDELIRRTEHTVIVELENGNRRAGMTRLRVVPVSDRHASPWITLRLGLFTGCFVTLACSILLSLYMGWYQHEPEDARTLPESPWVAVRLFRGFLLLFFNVFLIGINMYGWQTAGVNHVLIFELNPRQHVNFQSTMEIGAFFCTLWALAVLGYLHGGYIGLPPLLFPILLMTVSLLWLLNPFHKQNITYGSSRWWFISCAMRCFTAPFHYVRFPDFWLADEMNSMVTFFLDMGYFACFYVTSVDYSNATIRVRTWGGDVSDSHLLNQTLPHSPAMQVDFCSSHTYAFSLIRIIPPLIRFLQCLRRFRDTKHYHPHLTNAGKYASSFLIVLCGVFYLGNQHHDRSSKLFLILWVGSYLINFVYTYSWDIVMDWGLLQINAPKSQRLLRDELVYKRKFMYYLAIVEDFVLRLTWIFAVCAGPHNLHLVECIRAPLECIRRFVWNFFRLENEHLNNCGEFRAVRLQIIEPIRTKPAINSNHVDLEATGRPRLRSVSTAPNLASLAEYIG